MRQQKQRDQQDPAKIGAGHPAIIRADSVVSTLGAEREG
jgi:hypothetical protein